MRKFLTLDGEVIEETDWYVKPMDKCFYCSVPLIETLRLNNTCASSLDGSHDWVTLVNPVRNWG